MLEVTQGLLVYLTLKAGGYALWCVVGARLVVRPRRSIAAGIALGMLRLVIGWITGVAVAPVAIAAVQADRVPLFYFTALVIVRWFEWGVIELLLQPPPSRTLASIATGASPSTRWWRLAGIVVSYLADAPFLLAGGFPRGRIFC